MANTTISTMLATTAVLTLVACSGSSSGSSSGSGISNIATTRLFAEDVGPVSAAFADGKKLVSQDGNIMAVISTVGSGKNEVSEDIAMSIRYDGNSGMILDLNGREYTFRSSDLEVNDDGSAYSYFFADRVNDIYLFIGSRNGEILPFVEGKDTWFVKLFEFQFDTPDYVVSELFNTKRGYTVVGSETTLEAMGRFRAQSTYNGSSNGMIFNNDEDRTWENRRQIDADLNIDVDFSQKTMSGELSNIELVTIENGSGNWDNGDSIAGKILLQNGVITGAGFSGTTQTDSDLEASLSINTASGTFQGNFYGSDAQQLGATYNFSNNDINAVGGFIAVIDNYR